ncbi:MAG: zinc ABC transporter substrate-binding protein [Gemmatimonadetes bacterium]|nr:zinc ABC transporter substrate-binding protein [Gemmatimonadota bacterium]
MSHCIRAARLAGLGLALAALAAPTASAQKKIRVLTTTQDLAAIAREIGGEDVEVKAIARGYQDPHFVESKPSFILEASRADMLVFVGLDLEIGWLPNVITGSRNRRIQQGGAGYVDASRGVRLQEIPTGRITRELGDIHTYGNPHYWLDPANGRVIADNILAGLRRVDPQRAERYGARRDAFVTRLDRKIVEWTSLMAPYRGLHVVAYHNSWPYFVRAFGLVVDEFLEPKPGIPPSPSHIAAVIRLMRESGTKIILMEPYFSRKVPDLVAAKAGGKVVELAPSVAGTKEIATYFDLFDHDLRQLVAAARETGGGSQGASAARPGRGGA